MSPRTPIAFPSSLLSCQLFFSEVVADILSGRAAVVRFMTSLTHVLRLLLAKFLSSIN